MYVCIILTYFLNVLEAFSVHYKFHIRSALKGTASNVYVTMLNSTNCKFEGNFLIKMLRKIVHLKFYGINWWNYTQNKYL